MVRVPVVVSPQRKDLAALAGTPTGTHTFTSQRRKHSARRLPEAHASRPSVDHGRLRRSSDGEPAASESRCGLQDLDAAIVAIGLKSSNRARLRPVDGLGNGLVSAKWLRGLDLNQRPLGYEPNELPGCSTPHLQFSNSTWRGQRFDRSLPYGLETDQPSLSPAHPIRYTSGIL